DPLTRTQLARHLERGPGNGARRHPHEQPLLACEPARERECILLPRRNHAIDDRAVEVVGDEAWAHPLKLVLAALSAAQHRRARRLHRYHLDRRVALLQETTHARD